MLGLLTFNFWLPRLADQLLYCWHSALPRSTRFKLNYAQPNGNALKPPVFPNFLREAPQLEFQRIEA